jgi:hypothetical protein
MYSIHMSPFLTAQTVAKAALTLHKAILYIFILNMVVYYNRQFIIYLGSISNPTRRDSIESRRNVHALQFLWKALIPKMQTSNEHEPGIGVSQHREYTAVNKQFCSCMHGIRSFVFSTGPKSDALGQQTKNDTHKISNCSESTSTQGVSS